MDERTTTASTNPNSGEKKNENGSTSAPVRNKSVRQMIDELKLATQRKNPRDYAPMHTHRTKVNDPHRRCDSHSVQVYGYSTVTVKVTECSTEETKKQ